MKTKKKLSLMLAVILLLQIILPMLTVIWESGFTIKSVAAETYEATVDGITWTYEVDEQNNAINVKPKDKSNLPKEVAIPSALNGHTVTSIGDSAFSYCRSLTSITIPEGVTSIGKEAFSDCRSLTSITIPEGVTSIGSSAFSSCSSLTSITIPEGVTSIGYSTFFYCSSLTSINVDENNQNYSSENGVLFNKEKTEILCYPAKKVETSYVIPSTVTRIRESAFSSCRSLTSITIPEGVTSIGYRTFENCSRLTSITIPESVTSIGYWAFDSCRSLTSITIPESVTSIGSIIFSNCSSLTSINVDKNNQNYMSENGVLFDKEKTELIEYPIGNTRTSYSIPEGVTSIKGYAFSDCSSLTSITIPESVISIGTMAFNSCRSLTSINVDENNQNYMSENGVLFNKEKTELIEYPTGNTITSYSIPEGVTSIGYRAFDNCISLTNITIPESVTSIGNNAFYHCISLTSIAIPDSVTRIGVSIFLNCNKVTIYCKSDSYAKEYAEENSIDYIIDDEAPVITSVEGNPSNWTKENVTLTINAKDTLSGLAEQAYSFDGGVTWQAENTKTYTENTAGIVIKVKDKVGNETQYTEEINITKIMKLEKTEITTKPNKTEYIEGQTFDKTGMKVTATYNDGTSKEVTNYTVTPNGALTTSDNKVTISYTENGVTKTAEHTIKVVQKGDANGNGKVDFMDILAINKHRLGKAQLEGIYLEAADVNGDNKVDFMDILQINKYRLGKIDSL